MYFRTLLTTFMLAGIWMTLMFVESTHLVLVFDNWKLQHIYIDWLWKWHYQYVEQLSGSTWGTKGFELKQQQIFLRTIWYGSLVYSLIFNFGLEKTLNLVYKLFLSSRRRRCNFYCQWLAHCPSSMLLEINVPDQGDLQKRKGENLFTFCMFVFTIHSF